MKLFSNEKDTFLKVVNFILLIWLVVAVVITLGIGVKIINKDTVVTYKEYSTSVCELDKIPIEEVDQDLVKQNCYASYIDDKKNIEKMNKANNDNIVIALANVIIISLAIHLLNKKVK